MLRATFPAISLLSFCMLASAAEPVAAVRSITVNGEGVVDVSPDAFSLTVSIHVRNKDLDQARGDAAVRSGKIIETAKTFALDRARTFTSSFFMRPIYQQDSAELQGHDVSQTIRFVVTDVSQAEDFTSAIIKAGATSVDALEFISLGAGDLWQPARLKAVEDARWRATGLASVLDQKLGSALNVKTLDNYENTTLGCRWDPLTPDAGSPGADKLRFVPPSNIKVRAHVQIEFSLVDAT